MSHLSGPRERRRIDAWWARLAAHRDRLAQQEQAAAQILHRAHHQRIQNHLAARLALAFTPKEQS